MVLSDLLDRITASWERVNTVHGGAPHASTAYPVGPGTGLARRTHPSATIASTNANATSASALTAATQPSAAPDPPIPPQSVTVAGDPAAGPSSTGSTTASADDTGIIDMAGDGDIVAEVDAGLSDTSTHTRTVRPTRAATARLRPCPFRIHVVRRTA